MAYLTRRFLMPLMAMALGFAGLAIWLRVAAPPPLRHLLTTRSHTHTTEGGPHSALGILDQLAGAIQLALRVLEYAACALAVAGVAMGAMRVRARRTRARPGEVLCAELRLGRDDIAAPYEISKVFDGIAGAMRPGVIRRPLSGPATLNLKILSEGGTRSVRFLIQAPQTFHASIQARLRATYPDVRLIPVTPEHADPLALHTTVAPLQALRACIHRQPAPEAPVDVLRLRKARRWLWSLATTKDYEHSLIESLVSVMHALGTPCAVELLLTPAPAVLERYTGFALGRREQRMMAEGAMGKTEPGVDSVVAVKHLQGAVEGVGRAWWWFDIRVLVPRGHEQKARQLAGVMQETRGENYLRIRVMRARRRLYAWRSAHGLPPLWPALYSGAISSAEAASLWHLPTLRLKGVPLHRISAREITASSAISRDPAHAVMRDEYGPIGIHPADRRKGWMVLGAAGTGKTATLAPYAAAVANDDSRALVIVDPKEDFARLSLALIPEHRTVHYLDLGAPRYGLNILTAGHLTPEIRADIFIAVIRELAGETAVGPRSDLFLRSAIQAVAIVEPVPALQHVKALLDPFDPGYREWVTRELRYHHEVDFVRDYWQNTFPMMVKHNARFVAEAVSAPTNKIGRFLASPSLNLLMTHPLQLDLENIIRRREVLVVNGSKGAVGEDNANLFCSMLIVLIQHGLHQMQRLHAIERVQTTLVIDEAHNVFTPSFATLLSEGRSGGIEVAAAFQYTGQITDERVKAGVKSLLQNITIFRQRDFQDARAAASLAMEVFQDNIRGEIEDQRRLRIDPMDIVNQPDHRAVNLWLANGIPQPGFTADTTPMENLAYGPATTHAREHHEHEQQQRGYHPHDEGRYIQPPLVRSTTTPVLAQYRTVHIDLTGWTACPPPNSIQRVTLLLQPSDGQPLGLTAQPHDQTGRHYTLQLTEDQQAIGWLPAGRYTTQVLVWTDADQDPKVWALTHNPNSDEIPLALHITDEPRRPINVTLPA